MLTFTMRSMKGERFQSPGSQIRFMGFEVHLDGFKSADFLEWRSYDREEPAVSYK